MTAEEALEAYEATLPRLYAARDEHDDAYRESQKAYVVWSRLTKKVEEPGHGRHDARKS